MTAASATPVSPTAGLDAAARALVEAWKPSSDWFGETRVAAQERFIELGVPGPHDETWRQTPTKVIHGTAWAAAPEVEADPAWTAALGLDGWDGPQI
ncbi:MAG: hypothetical protein ACYTGX_16710, partial [Planctomycetota bacterium]